MSGWERIMITSSSNLTGIEQQLMQPIETEPRALDELSTLHLAVVETSPEQPTQPIDTKLQAPEGLSTLLLAVVAKSPEQQPTQPMAMKHAFQVWRWLLPSLLCVLLIGGVLSGRAALTHWLPAAFSPAQTPFIIPSHHIYTHSSKVDSARQSFMDAMMHKAWAKMWLMLSPDAQQLYQGKQDFVRFEQAKFGKLRFVSYKESATEQVQPWLDPDTTQVYPVATIQYISLEATAPPGMLTDPSNLALGK